MQRGGVCKTWRWGLMCLARSRQAGRTEDKSEWSHKAWGSPEAWERRQQPCTPSSLGRDQACWWVPPPSEVLRTLHNSLPLSSMSSPFPGLCVAWRPVFPTGSRLSTWGGGHQHHLTFNDHTPICLVSEQPLISA